jgi:hypothetical protein
MAELTVRNWNGETLVVRRCEQKMAAFCAVDAYARYDVKGRPDAGQENLISPDQIHAANSAMRARSPLSAWESAGLLTGALDELTELGVGLDLMATSEKHYAADVRPRLARLYGRVLQNSGIGAASGTKVLHLLRPRLIAIADSVVVKWLGVKRDSKAGTALAVADVVRGIGCDKRNHAALEATHTYLGRSQFVARAGVIPSACRIVDALLWMQATKQYDDLWEVMGLVGS